MAHPPMPANHPDLHELGAGSAVRVEPDGGLTLYLDHRDPGLSDFPEWVVSHALPPREAAALRTLLRPGA